MLIQASQIDSASLNLAIQRGASGASFSGNLTSYLAASGWIGPLAVTVTGAQDVTGIKTFRDSPRVPYSGTTGSAPSARWVNDQIAAASSSSSTSISALSGYVQGASGALSYVRVTGSATIGAANFTGLGGTLVIYSGSQIFISGAAAGAGGAATGSNVSVTGSATLSNVGLTGGGGVVVSYVVETGPSAAAPYVLISGSVGADSTLSGYVEGNFVHRGTVDDIVSGVKYFTGNPQIPAPILPSGAANLIWVSGVSGVLVARDLTISGVLYHQITGASGAIIAGSTFNNTYYITGTGVVAASSTGVVTNTFNITSGNADVSSSGTVNNTFNGVTNVSLGIVTGNFVNLSYYFNEFSLATGLNQVESMIGRSFVFTGYAIGCINTGTQGFLSGAFYQRTSTNTKTAFVDVSLNSGTFFTAQGGFVQPISGLNRVGLDIYRIGTGITGLSIGLFGLGF